MSEALRSIFAEIGFDVDLASLVKLETSLKAATKATAGLPVSVDEAAKRTKTKLEEIAKAAKKLAADADKAQVDHEGKKLFDDSDAGKAHAAWKRLAELEEAAKKPITGLMGLLEKFHAKNSAIIGKALPASYKAALVKMGVASGDFAAMGEVAAAGALAVVVAVKRAIIAAVAFAGEFSAAAEALRDTARESRVTTTQLQELDHAAAQGGVGVERMRAGVQTFGQSLRAAERWGNGTTGMLRRLGIQARDSGGHIRPTGELMDEVAGAMEHIQNPTRRARVAIHLFGESGRRMLDILHTGPGGIRALREELAELGGGVTPEAVAASRQYTMATEKLARAQDSLRSVLAVTLLPVLTAVVTAGAQLGGLFARLTNGTHVVQVALGMLGVVAAAVAIKMVVAFAPVVLPLLAWAAAAAAVVLVMDDLITFVNGGDSAIGRFIDSMFGVGTSVQYVHELREEWEAVQNAIASAIAKLAEWTGMGEQQAQGTLRAPRLGSATTPGARRAPRVTAIPSSQIMIAGSGGQPVTVPASHSVTAPGSIGGARTIVRQTTHAPNNTFHITNPDPRATAAEAVRLLQQQERDRRDGDHPVEDHDG